MPQNEPRGKIKLPETLYPKKKETVTPAAETVTTDPVVVTDPVVAKPPIDNKNKVPLQPVINNKTSSQSTAEQITGRTLTVTDFLKQITKDVKPTSKSSSSTSNWTAKDAKTGVSYDEAFNAMTESIVKQNEKDNPNISKEVFRNHKAAKQAINGQLINYTTELKGTSLEKPLTDFTTQSGNYSNAARQVYILEKKLTNAQTTFNSNKTKENADNYNNIAKQYKEQFKLYSDYAALYNSTKETLVNQANKSNGKLVYYNDKFYNGVDFRKVNESPVIPNVTSAFSSDAQLVVEGNTIKNYYDNTDTGAAYEMLGDIESASLKEIENLRDPVLKSLYEKAFDSYNIKDTKNSIDNIETMHMFEDLLESVVNYGTIEDTKVNTFSAKLMLTALKNTGSLNGQAELFNKAKKQALEFIDVLGYEQKNKLFEVASFYYGQRQNYYPGTNVTDKEKSFTKTKGLANKIKAYDEFIKFKENLSDLAIEKLIVGYKDIPILNGKNNASQADIKKLFQNFVNPKTGEFVSAKDWQYDKKQTLENVFRAQQGLEITLGGNEVLDAVDYFSYRLARPSTWLDGMNGDFDTDFEYFADDRAAANQRAWYEAKNNEIYEDVKKQYKKIYDKLDLQNLANFKKSTIQQLGNYRNMPLEYVGLDLSLTDDKSVLKADDQDEPSEKHDNASKIINLLKNTNGNWISDAEGQDIEVLSEKDLEDLGTYSLTEKKLNSFSRTNENLESFFKTPNDNVTLRFFRNTSIPDKARYDFIQDEGSKEEKRISVLIPYTKLDDNGEDGKGEILFNGTKLTPEEFNFKLNGDSTTFPTYIDEVTNESKYTSATMKKSIVTGQQVYKLEINFVDPDGNNKVIRQTINNASLISSTDATNAFNNFLKIATYADLVEQSKSDQENLLTPN